MIPSSLYIKVYLKLWSKVSQIFLLFSLYFSNLNLKYLKLTKMDITHFAMKLFTCPVSLNFKYWSVFAKSEVGVIFFFRSLVYLKCTTLICLCMAVLQLLSWNELWKFPEFHKISWNFRKGSSLLFQLYMMLLIPDFFILKICFFILENPQNSWKLLNSGRSGSTGAWTLCMQAHTQVGVRRGSNNPTLDLIFFLLLFCFVFVFVVCLLACSSDRLVMYNETPTPCLENLSGQTICRKGIKRVCELTNNLEERRKKRCYSPGPLSVLHPTWKILHTPRTVCMHACHGKKDSRSQAVTTLYNRRQFLPHFYTRLDMQGLDNTTNNKMYNG